MTTAQNVMPARTAPQVGGAEPNPVLSHLLLACGPGVGATTLARILASRPGPGRKVQRILTIADTDTDADTATADGGGEVLDCGSEQRAGEVCVAVAEALSEGAIVDCAPGAVGRIIRQAAEIRVGRLIEADVTAALVVGRAPASARRASAHLRAFGAWGNDLHVARIVVVFVDAGGRPSPRQMDDHAALRGQAASANAGVAEIPAGDLTLAERFGFSALLGMAEAELAGKLGVTAIRAGAEVARFENFIKSARTSLRAAGASAPRAPAKGG